MGEMREGGPSAPQSPRREETAVDPSACWPVRLSLSCPPLGRALSLASPHPQKPRVAEPASCLLDPVAIASGTGSKLCHIADRHSGGSWSCRGPGRVWGCSFGVELGFPEGRERPSQGKTKEKYFVGPRPERVFVEENVSYGFAGGNCVPAKVNPLLPLSFGLGKVTH